MDGNAAFPLLSLPYGGVQQILVEKLVANTLWDLLNFRLVCKATKDWIDQYPTRCALTSLSKTQVRIDCNIQTIKRFVESAPSFPVTSLCFDISQKKDLSTNTGKKKRTKKSDKLQEIRNSYLEYWKPRLGSLTITSNGPGQSNYDDKDVNFVLHNLLDSPNLKKVHFLDEAFSWKVFETFPRPFWEISDLTLITGNSDLHDRPIERNFFQNLAQNNKLKSLTVEFKEVNGLDPIRTFIETKKHCRELRISLIMSRSFKFPDLINEEFLNLIKTSVAAECEIRFRLVGDDWERSINFQAIKNVFRRAKDELDVIEYSKFVNNQVEGLRKMKAILDSNFIILQDMEELRYLQLSGRLREDELARLRLPPKLEELECWGGLPDCEYLPQNLKKLTLHYFQCSMEELERSLYALSKRCVNLEFLDIQVQCDDGDKGVVSKEDHSGVSGSDGDLKTLKFRKLESLGLRLYADEKGLIRELILNRLQIHQMPLLYLTICLEFATKPDPAKFFRQQPSPCQVSKYSDPDLLEIGAYEEHFNTDHELHLLDRNILNHFCEGPISSTLLCFNISQEFFPSYSTELIKLKNITCRNVKARLLKEGKGRWCYNCPKELHAGDCSCGGCHEFITKYPKSLQKCTLSKAFVR